MEIFPRRRCQTTLTTDPVCSSCDTVQKCRGDVLEARLSSLRPPEATKILDPERANDVAGEHDGAWGGCRVLRARPEAWYVWVRPADQDWPTKEEIEQALKGPLMPGWTSFHPGGARSFVTLPCDEPAWRWLLTRRRGVPRVIGGFSNLRAPPLNHTGPAIDESSHSTMRDHTLAPDQWPEANPSILGSDPAAHPAGNRMMSCAPPKNIPSGSTTSCPRALSASRVAAGTPSSIATWFPSMCLNRGASMAC